MLPDSPSRWSAEPPADKTGAICCCAVAAWKLQQILEGCRSAWRVEQRRVDYTAQRKQKACSPESSERAELPGDPDNDALDFHIQE